MPKYIFKKWEDDSINPTRTITLINDLSIEAIYEEETLVVKYKPSEVTILVHAKQPTTLTANPSEIGTETNPLDEGAEVPIEATLLDKLGSPIQGKQLHLYNPDGTEVNAQTTDANGKASFTYTANSDHDGKLLSIKYLGD